MGKRGGVFTGKTKLKFKRQDSDLALSYRLNDYFKVFCGIKYIGYSMISLNGSGLTNKHNGYGPGLGLSATFPIIGNLFLIGNVAGIYLWGKVKVTLPWTDKDAKYKEKGVNSTLQFAYYIEPVSTVISLGGRFQYIVTEYYDNDGMEDLFIANNKTKFYGITLTATYNFNI